MGLLLLGFFEGSATHHELRLHVGHELLELLHFFLLLSSFGSLILLFLLSDDLDILAFLLQFLQERLRSLLFQSVAARRTETFLGGLPLHIGDCVDRILARSRYSARLGCKLSSAWATLLQHLLESSNLIFVLLQEGVLGVLVHPRLVLDSLGSRRVSQRGQRLV